MATHPDGRIVVDDQQRTTVDGIFALGDVSSAYQLKHVANHEAKVVAHNLLHPDAPRRSDHRFVPSAVFTDPQIASVGLTEARAKEQYGADKIKAYNYPLGGNGKSQILKTTGFVKLVRVIDGPVVGLHMVGARVGELVGEAQLIFNWEAYPAEVAQLIHAHPTQSEALGEAHLALAGKPLHAHA